MECKQFLKLVMAAIEACVAWMQCAMVQRIAALGRLGGPGWSMKRLLDADKAHAQYAWCSTCEIPG